MVYFMWPVKINRAPSWADGQLKAQTNVYLYVRTYSVRRRLVDAPTVTSLSRERRAKREETMLEERVLATGESTLCRRGATKDQFMRQTLS